MCLVILFGSYILQSDLVVNFTQTIDVFENFGLSNKFDAYASTSGIDKYNYELEESYNNSNNNYRLFIDFRHLTHKILLPILILFGYLNKSSFKSDRFLSRILNVSIIFLAFYNLAEIFNEGFRYGYIFSFTIAGFFFFINSSLILDF